jgi:DNA-binding response OmpR family regulator
MTSTAKILVVDDEASLRLTMTEMLSRDGHQVTTAASGQIALALIKTQSFDLALVDLHLGDMVGTELLAAIRQQSPDMVVIMLTAYASLETAVEALRQGAHDYLFKPCSTVELRESIRQGLLKRQQTIKQRALLQQLGQYIAANLEDIQSLVKEQFPGPAPTTTAIEPPNKSLILNYNEPAQEQQGRFQQQGGLIVDFVRHVITLDGHLLELSPTEFSLLAYLISEAPRVIPPQELTREVQGYDSDPWEAGETMRSHMYHIRQKIKKAAGRANVIRTLRGVGYTISE